MSVIICPCVNRNPVVQPSCFPSFGIALNRKVLPKPVPPKEKQVKDIFTKLKAKK